MVDVERYTALKEGRNFDTKETKSSHIPEVQLYNEIKQFYRMFQTEETEDRLKKLEQIASLIEENVPGDIAMDVMGSTNMGLCENTSDIDFVVYVRCDLDFKGDINSCSQFKEAQKIIEAILKPKYAFQIMDSIDLNLVEKSIRAKDYESDMAMRFVAYRAICRPINYRFIAPIEDLLNQDMEYRAELEGSIRSYFRIFINTSQHTRSFKKYESRIRGIGINLPEAIRTKIKAYFQQDSDQKDCPVDFMDSSPES